MRYEQIKGLKNTDFKRLTGVKRGIFEKMLEVVREGRPVTEEQKASNRALLRQRIRVENIIDRLKVIRILSERYRNRRRRFALRFNLIAAICTLQLKTA
jgi:hypothetical protein